MNPKRILYTLSGDDYTIIGLCTRRVKNQFASIGAFVLVIFILCFLGSLWSFSQLFDSNVIAIPLGLFFAFMITNIYLLLLYTLTKNSFPTKPYRATQVVSVGVRGLFICFIALVVSKPVETYIFSGQLDQEIANYKIAKIEKYTASTNENHAQEILEIQSLIDGLNRQYHEDAKGQIEEYQAILSKKEAGRISSIETMTRLVENSKFFVQGIVILSTKFWWSWFITGMMVFVFLFPAVLKHFLGKKSDYFERKKQIENQLVLDEYDQFKFRYSDLIKQRFDREVTFCELHVDPPFNTKLKSDKRKFLSEDDLINRLYGPWERLSQ